MYIRRGQSIRCAGIAIGHRHDDGFRQTKHALQIGMIAQCGHDGQFRRAGIAKQNIDALVLQQRQKGETPDDGLHVF